MSVVIVYKNLLKKQLLGISHFFMKNKLLIYDKKVTFFFNKISGSPLVLLIIICCDPSNSSWSIVAVLGLKAYEITVNGVLKMSSWL